MADKISIRLPDEKEVRAVWDGEHPRWWFSVLDLSAFCEARTIIRKPATIGNISKQSNNQPGSVTTRFKFTAPDGKYVGINVASSFMERNGLSTRIRLDLIFRKNLKHCVDRIRINKKDYPDAMRESAMNANRIKTTLSKLGLLLFYHCLECRG